jgi:hypothetical protein
MSTTRAASGQTRAPERPIGEDAEALAVAGARSSHHQSHGEAPGHGEFLKQIDRTVGRQSLQQIVCQSFDLRLPLPNPNGGERFLHRAPLEQRSGLIALTPGVFAD